MILIPSAFFEVLFEPITDPIKQFYTSVKFYVRWTVYITVYLLSIGVIFFGAVALFVFGSELSKWLGV